MSVIVAAAEPHGSRIASALADEDVDVVLTVAPAELVRTVGDQASRIWDALRVADTVVIHATRTVLVPEVVAMCDRSGARIVALGDRAAERRTVAAFGLPPALPLAASGPELRDAIATRSFPAESPDEVTRGSVTVVWGPHGAPGRTTLVLALAAALALDDRRVAVVDADTHAPSVAQRLDLPDEAPGFPAACRQTDYGVLDDAELTRLSAPVDLGSQPIEVLTGINRPARWPELSSGRVVCALDVARSWADHILVDVGASLDADEEIASDIDAPRRNQAALAALGAADSVIALGLGDPVGMSRLIRGLARLDEVAAAAERRTVVNRVSGGAVGVDAAGQVRRALAQYGDIDDVWLLPDDPRAAERALLGARPVLPRRRPGLAHAVGRLAATL